MNPLDGRVPDVTTRQSEALGSWKEIAAYLGKGVTTVRRWEREERLPVRRQEHIRRGSVLAYKSELDEWRRSRTTEFEAAPTKRTISSLAVVAVVVIAAVVAGARWNTHRKWEPGTQLLQLTSSPGDEGSVSFAPGGRRFAYATDGHVVIKETGVEPSRELYTYPGHWICCVSWSPDGSKLAVSHSTATYDWQITLIDPNGRVLRHLGPGGPSMAWRPDGKALLYAHRPSGNATSIIIEHDLANSRARQISFPPEGFWGDIAVAVEDNGRRLALARYNRVSRGDVYVSGYGAHEAVPVTHLQNWIVGVDWLPQGQGIVFGGTVAGHDGLHRVAADGSGSPTLINGTEGVNRYPHAVSLGKNSIRVGFGHESWNPDLRMLERNAAVAAPVASSTQSDEFPDLSAEGYLAFVSSRSGLENVWVCPPGCGQLRQITNFRERQYDIYPRWSPDGRQLALAIMLGGQARLMVMGAEGQNERTVSQGTGESRPSWSADGRFLYFQSDRSGRPEIWRISASGDGPARQITRNGGIEAFESADGAGIFFIRTNETSVLYRVPAGGGAEAPVEGMPTVRLGDWHPAGNTILYWSVAKHGIAGLHEFDLSTKRTVRTLVQSKGTPIHGFSVNSRGDAVWSERGPVRTDLQAVDLTFQPFWKVF